MDLDTVTRALDDLYARYPHLPRPDSLERTVLDAWSSAPGTNPGASDGPAAAVVRATWPIGARAGARRGHEVTAAAIRDMVAHGLRDQEGIDPPGRWVLWACARAADELPAVPDTTEVERRVNGFHQWIGDIENLEAALTLGLANGWLAGHRDASMRLIERFGDQVTDTVGADTLTTTFLIAAINGDDVVFAVGAAAYSAAERDQQQPPAAPMPEPPNGAPVAGRPFIPLRELGPESRNRPNTGPPPTPGTGQHRAGR